MHIAGFWGKTKEGWHQRQSNLHVRGKALCTGSLVDGRRTHGCDAPINPRYWLQLAPRVMSSPKQPFSTIMALP